MNPPAQEGEERTGERVCDRTEFFGRNRAGALDLRESLFDPARTMSVHFYLLAREGISREKADATAAVLVLAIIAINGTAYAIMNRFMRKFR